LPIISPYNRRSGRQSYVSLKNAFNKQELCKADLVVLPGINFFGEEIVKHSNRGEYKTIKCNNQAILVVNVILNNKYLSNT
jgi:hypothetical protein